MLNDKNYGVYTVNGNDHGGHGDTPAPKQQPATPGKPSKPQSKEGKQTPGKK